MTKKTLLSMSVVVKSGHNSIAKSINWNFRHVRSNIFDKVKQ